MTPSEALAEARRRIADARDRRLPWLDLGDLGLAEIPPEIGELSELRVLALGRNKLIEGSADSEWKLDHNRSYPSYTCVEPLRALSGLTALDLSWCY